MADEERPPLGEVGIFGDIPEDEYHASPGLSQSALKILGEEGGPAKFRYGVQKDTRPQKLGTLVHSLLLRPNEVMQNYRVTRLTRDGTKDWKEEQADHSGKIMVKQPEFDKAMGIVEAVFRWSSGARELLLSPDRIMTEASFWWVNEETGLLCRGRADAWHEDYQVIIDLKTARSASTDGFRRAVREYGYAIQRQWYVGGWPLAGGRTPVDFVFVVVEPDFPHMTASYVLDKEDLEDAQAKIRRLMDIHQECERSGIWPGYDPGVQTLPPINRKRDFDV